MEREQLRELVINYGEFLEAEDYSEEAVKKIFTDDAVVEFAVGGTGTGISEIAVKHQEMMASFVSAHHNITNIFFESGEDNYVKLRFHMEVIHEFKAEIAANTPGNLFIVNDRIYTEAKKEEGKWKFNSLKMQTVYRRMMSSME